MEITATVRLKNFEHIVDLIEQDGGEVSIANYKGNGKTVSKKARKKRAKANNYVTVTPEIVASVLAGVAKHPGATNEVIARRYGKGISAETARRIIRRDHPLSRGAKK
jgi:ribosomal protein S25